MKSCCPVYNVQVEQNSNVSNKNDKYSFYTVGVFHELYNIQLNDKHKNLFKDMCCNNAYLIIILEDQYVENQNKNATQITSATIRVGMADIQTLQPQICQIMFHRYDAHAESKRFICLKQAINNFTSPSVLSILSQIFKLLQITITP